MFSPFGVRSLPSHPLQEVIDWFETNYGLEIGMIMRTGIIWASFGASKEVQQRISKPLGPLLQSDDALVPILVIPSYTTADGDSLDVEKTPTVLYRRAGFSS